MCGLGTVLGLFLLAGLFHEPCLALPKPKSPCSKAYSSAKTKHSVGHKEKTEIELTNDSIAENQFTVDRGMAKADYIFSNRLGEYLESHAQSGKPVKWMDWGAGLANVQRSFIRLNGYTPGVPFLPLEAHAVAFRMPKVDSYHDPKSKSQVRALKASIKKGEISYREADLNQPFDSGEKYDLATDILGALSYVRDLGQALRSEVGALKKGGKLFVHTTNYSATIETSRGPLTLAEFLETVPGLKVEYLPSRPIGFLPSYGELSELNFIVTKTRETVEIPELRLDEKAWIDEIPPFRRYLTH